MIDNTEKAIVQREQLAQMLSFNNKTMFSNSFLAVFLAYVQLGIVQQWAMLSWLIPVLSVNVIRFFINRHYIKHTTQDPAVVSRRLNIFRAGLIVSTLIWGMNILLVMDTSTEQVLFLGFLLAGLSAGSSLVYSIDFICAIAFAIFSLTPAIFYCLLSDDEFLCMVGFSGAFYILFLIVSIKTIHYRLKEGVLLREEAMKNAEEIKQLAFYDSLTGLPNRRLLLERLERAFLQSWRTGKRCVVLFLDLDHFKKLNDTFGHDEGDALLVQVAERLKGNVRESDTVSRFGGDEFVVILENLNEDAEVALQEADKLTKLILKNLSQPYPLSDVEYMSTPSIGVAMLGTHGSTQQELLKNADIAMYHAKKSGRNVVSVYDETMQEIVGVE